MFALQWKEEALTACSSHSAYSTSLKESKTQLNNMKDNNGYSSDAGGGPLRENGGAENTTKHGLEYP